ncbi:hypothetical protein H9649_07525 [Sporosarcina sp. Sa2YVA2]|uniref:Uncharacterized protein n=1 Tax=Sporosarcina quadrami TaxID=2762234 RepID=A0ABR8U9M3_9BACL|nr:hypothetical protein [Sporosarcina quadrami]MBD7984424.1 hypothetical protein [Sporosarcina quadrami]
MKETTTIAIAWMSVSLAVIVAIMTTGSLKVMWAFLLPALLSTSSSKQRE